MMKTSPDGSKRYFFMPFPQEDVVFNPNLGSNVDGVHVDVRATYSYWYFSLTPIELKIKENEKFQI